MSIRVVVTRKGDGSQLLEEHFEVDENNPLTFGRSPTSNRLHLPDILGIGASWQPNDRMTVAADVEWVRHSNLLDGFVAGVNVLTDELGVALGASGPRPMMPDPLTVTCATPSSVMTSSR